MRPSSRPLSSCLIAFLRPRPLLAALLACAFALSTGGPAQAQGRGHGAGGLGGSAGLGMGGGMGGGLGGGLGGLPSSPTLPPLPRPEGVGRTVDDTARKPAGLLQRAERTADAATDVATGRHSLGQDVAEATGSRRSRIEELVITHPEQLELDARGEPAVRGELVLHDPSAALLRGARAAGFRTLREQRLPELDLRLVVLSAPPGVDLDTARERLRSLDPDAAAGLNHLYLPMGATGGSAPPLPPVAFAPGGHALRIGLIDGGVDATHPALKSTRVVQHGCARPVPSVHGTAVASLLAGHDGGFRGAVRAQQLHAADVYCGQPTGGSLQAILSALAWMAREQVPVINVSLVGPASPLLARAVSQLVNRGHLLVAAVGNDGPASPPLYPAAYSGVVGVSGVDARRRVLPEALQGPQVAFTAPGADLATAALGGGYTVARGTSFASPLVAGLLAAVLARPDPLQAQRALQALRRDAHDLGVPGPDPVYGLGLVAEGLRVPPAQVAARAGAL